LQATLRSTLDLTVAAATLEALTLGWLDTPGLSELHDAALASRYPTLRLVGISGRLVSQRADESDRDALVDLLSEDGKLDYWDRPDAARQLSQHWPDDAKIIDLVLHRSSTGDWRDRFDSDAAKYYLVRCSPTNTAVANWVRRELNKKYPFS